MASSKQAAQQKNTGGFGRFFRETKTEIKKVVWPNKQELINSTIVVFITVLVISIIIGVVDSIFSKLFQFLMHLLG